MDWFERLTGFREGSYDDTRAKLASRDDGCVARQRHEPGRSANLKWSRSGRCASERSRDPAWPAEGEGRREATSRRCTGAGIPGALFQVASQFNALEMIGPDVTPEHGVSRYQRDPTQGPACAIAAGAATIYRNFFVARRRRPRPDRDAPDRRPGRGRRRAERGVGKPVASSGECATATRCARARPRGDLGIPRRSEADRNRRPSRQARDRRSNRRRGHRRRRGAPARSFRRRSVRPFRSRIRTCPRGIGVASPCSSWRPRTRRRCGRRERAPRRVEHRAADAARRRRVRQRKGLDFRRHPARAPGRGGARPRRARRQLRDEPSPGLTKWVDNIGRERTLRDAPRR